MATPEGPWSRKMATPAVGAATRAAAKRECSMPRRVPRKSLSTRDVLSLLLSGFLFGARAQPEVRRWKVRWPLSGLEPRV